MFHASDMQQIMLVFDTTYLGIYNVLWKAMKLINVT